ncbi:reverse transcriptase domain-containing protein [Tanacetum coccineum]
MSMPSLSNLKQMQSLSGKLAALNRFLSKAVKRVIPCLDTLKKCTNKKDFCWTEAAEEAFQAMKRLIAEQPTLTAPMKDEELMLYLSATNEVFNAMVLVERKGRHIPIHYMSRSLQGVEINHSPMEKLALALVYTARRLRRYFQGHAFKVVTKTLINQILNSPEVSRRLANPKDLPESSKRQIDPELAVEADVWKLYTNKASNNHRAGARLILIDPEDMEYSYALRLNFRNSNNDAEYEALLPGLRIAKEIKVKNIHAFVDSKLVASQVEGSYEARGEKTKKYKEKVLEVITALTNSK